MGCFLKIFLLSCSIPLGDLHLRLQSKRNLSKRISTQPNYPHQTLAEQRYIYIYIHIYTFSYIYSIYIYNYQLVILIHQKKIELGANLMQKDRPKKKRRGKQESLSFTNFHLATGFFEAIWQLPWTSKNVKIVPCVF